MTTPQTGAELIAAERQRQIEQEGWTAEHDDNWTEGELPIAAACYAVASEPEVVVVSYRYADDGADAWPFDQDKRSDHDPLRRLVIAGALIAAEIDRVLREDARLEEARE